MGTVLCMLSAGICSRQPGIIYGWHELTHIRSAQSTAQGPGPQVHKLAVDIEGLDAALETTVGARCPHQPVDTGRPAQVQGGAEGNLGVLALLVE